MDYLSAGHDFGLIDRRSQAYVTEACQPWGLSYSEYTILMNLYGHNGCQQTDICRALKADKALVARTLKSLEGKGFISRRQEGRDKRCKYIFLTPEAWDIQTVMEGIIRKWVETLVRGIDEKALDEAFRLMHAVAENAAAANLNDINPTKEMNL